MFDAVKNALSAAKALVASGGATAGQVGNLADDLLATSRNNRDTVLALVRYEIDRAIVRLGLATSEEISALAKRIDSLESAVREAVSAGSSGSPKPSAAAPPAGAPSRPTKRATKAARKAPAKRSPAKRAPAKRATGQRSPRDPSGSTGSTS